jgi:hypothetical protein
MKTLVTTEVEALFSPAVKRKYHGIFMRNEIPKNYKAGYYLFNLGDADSMGTHWVLALITQKGEANLYFDPFGCSVPEEIKAFLKSRGDEVMYSADQLQDRHSSSCGWFVADAANYLEKNRKGSGYTDALYKYVTNVYSTDTTRNEKLLASRMK